MPELRIESIEFEKLAREILAEGRTLRFRVSGSSMRPFIRHGDLIRVEPVLAESYRVGDIFLFKSEGSGLLTHRLVRLRQSGDGSLLELKGDALLKPDGLISPSQIIGRVIGFERHGKEKSLISFRQRFLALIWIRLAPLVNPLLKFLGVLRFKLAERRSVD
jgi:signal peptidase I